MGREACRRSDGRIRSGCRRRWKRGPAEQSGPAASRPRRRLPPPEARRSRSGPRGIADDAPPEVPLLRSDDGSGGGGDPGGRGAKGDGRGGRDRPVSEHEAPAPDAGDPRRPEKNRPAQGRQGECCARPVDRPRNDADRVGGAPSSPPALPRSVQAIHSISTPILRNMGTIGGNICLDTRCNYYDQNYEWRRAINFCMKCDGDICWVAPKSKICLAVSSSDSAPVLCAYGARFHLASKE